MLAPRQVELVIRRDGHPDRRMVLAPGTVVVGRADDNDVVLSDIGVSRHHARIVVEDGGIFVEDMGSGNGTLFQGRRITRHPVTDSDELLIDPFTLGFHLTGGGPTAKVTADSNATVPVGQQSDRTEAFDSVLFTSGNVPTAAPHPAPAVELDFDVGKVKARKGPQGRLPRRSTGFFSRPINQVSAGIVVLAFVSVGGRMVFDMATPPAPSAATPLDAVTRDQVAALMSAGMQLLSEGKPFEAAGQFYNVQQIEPGNPDAERLGYVTCELIAMQTLYDGLAARSASEARRVDTRARALAAVADARKDASTLESARALLSEALAFDPTDAELIDAGTQLQKRRSSIARGVAVRREEKKQASLADMVAAAQREYDKGYLTRAVRGWEAVLEADPTRAAPQYHQAEAGISNAKDKMKADSKKAYAAGLIAFKNGDLVMARKQLDATVNTDPYNDDANTRLADVRKRLKEQASEIYKEARVLEDINQTDKALALYQKVLTYVDDSGDPLATKAQGRMNALLK